MELLSIGGVARVVHCSPGYIRTLERDGVLPRPLRLIGSDRRAYRREDVEAIRRILNERAARRAAATVEGSSASP